MKYTLLGASGLRVSRLCLGTAAFGVVTQRLACMLVPENIE